MTRPPLCLSRYGFHGRPQQQAPNQAETSPVSFMADPSDESILISKIQVGAYNIIRKQLATETSFSQLAERERESRSAQAAG